MNSSSIEEFATTTSASSSSSSSSSSDRRSSSKTTTSSSTTTVHHGKGKIDIDYSSLPIDEEGNYILPNDFIPTSFHTICARGKTYWDHKGNVRYRQLIASATKKYSQAGPDKLQKTLIVSEIVNALQQGGGSTLQPP